MHTLFVQGTNDDFLGHPKKDMGNLKAIMARMAGPTTLHEVPGGTHDVPKVGKKAEVEAAEKAVIERIVSFIQQRL